MIELKPAKLFVHPNQNQVNKAQDPEKASKHDTPIDIRSNDGQRDTNSLRAGDRDYDLGAKRNAFECMFPSKQTTVFEWEQKLSSMNEKWENRQIQLEAEIRALRDQIDSKPSRQLHD